MAIVGGGGWQVPEHAGVSVTVEGEVGSVAMGAARQPLTHILHLTVGVVRRALPTTNEGSTLFPTIS